MSADPYRTLPEPARAQHIVDALRKGDDHRTIGRSIDVNNLGYVMRQVGRIAADINRFDTDVDEVLVQRAYEGDKAAWVTLTHYERRTCLNKLMDRALAGRGHVRWPELLAVEAGAVELGWLDYWCEAVGEDQPRFRAMLNRRRVRSAA